MKVIFLDIDGVLNDCWTIEKSPAGFTGIDDEKVELLRELVDETDSKLVLTSTWKGVFLEGYKDGVYLRNKLAAAHLRIYDTTAEMDGKRAKEIESWLSIERDEAVEDYIILDDFDWQFNEEMKSHLLLMSGDTGLTKERKEMAKEMLMGRIDKKKASAFGEKMVRRQYSIAKAYIYKYITKEEYKCRMDEAETALKMWRESQQGEGRPA
jgi:hypothetical protein